jgi:MYXO-CTERM domain-containing protein
MKKCTILLAVLAVALLSTAAKADQVKYNGIGLNETMNVYDANGKKHYVYVGELKYDYLTANPSNPPGDLLSDPFRSFCIELNEEISRGGTYDVAINMDWAAVNGGSGGAVNGMDPISRGTAKLFHDYSYGVGSLFETMTNSKAAALQMAIWWLEDELAVSTDMSNNIFLQYLTGLDDTQGLIADWKTADYDPFGAEAPGVWVMNLTQNGAPKQDTLVMGSTAAPEPATMGIWALGMAGFAGVGAYRRRKNRKA